MYQYSKMTTTLRIPPHGHKSFASVAWSRRVSIPLLVACGATALPCELRPPWGFCVDHQHHNIIFLFLFFEEKTAVFMTAAASHDCSSEGGIRVSCQPSSMFLSVWATSTLCLNSDFNSKAKIGSPFSLTARTLALPALASFPAHRYKQSTHA